MTSLILPGNAQYQTFTRLIAGGNALIEQWSKITTRIAAHIDLATADNATLDQPIQSSSYTLTLTIPLVGASDNKPTQAHLISQLGWSRAEARAIRDSLMSFADDWDAPGMEAYDEM